MDMRNVCSLDNKYTFVFLKNYWYVTYAVNIFSGNMQFMNSINVNFVNFVFPDKLV